MEEALAAASKGISERIAAGSSVAAVQDEPAQGPTETAGDDSGVVERANLLTSAGESSRTHGPREVARFEDLMTIDRRDRTEPTPAAPAPVTVNEPPADGREGASDPGEAAAEYSRQAFWFEYSPALKPEPADESVVEPEAELETPVSYVEPDPAESVAPPVAESIAPPVAEPISSPAPAPRNHWVTVLCLLALIGLVVALTGRNPRRVSGGQAS